MWPAAASVPRLPATRRRRAARPQRAPVHPRRHPPRRGRRVSTYQREPRPRRANWRRRALLAWTIAAVLCGWLGGFFSPRTAPLVAVLAVVALCAAAAWTAAYADHRADE